MLIRLLGTYLGPYKRDLAGVILLQLVATGAALYLPSVNADLIDNGVAAGDTGYIMTAGGKMLLVTLVQIICSIGSVFFGARAAMGFGLEPAFRGGAPGFGASADRKSASRREPSPVTTAARTAARENAASAMSRSAGKVFPPAATLNPLIAPRKVTCM